MKKDIRVKLPEEDVEYTFVFPGKRFITYVYVGKTDKGRLVLMNVKNKIFTNMTPGWFANLRRRQLVSEKRLTPKKETSYPKLSLSQLQAESTQDTELRIIRELRNLTPSESFAVYSRIGRSPESLADDLERLRTDDGLTQEFINRVCGEMLKATSAYDALRANNQNNIFTNVF